MQTCFIPGTFLFNLMGGALFGMYLGFPICLAVFFLEIIFYFNFSATH